MRGIILVAGLVVMGLSGCVTDTEPVATIDSTADGLGSPRSYYGTTMLGAAATACTEADCVSFVAARGTDAFEVEQPLEGATLHLSWQSGTDEPKNLYVQVSHQDGAEIASATGSSGMQLTLGDLPAAAYWMSMGPEFETSTYTNWGIEVRWHVDGMQ